MHGVCVVWLGTLADLENGQFLCPMFTAADVGSPNSTSALPLVSPFSDGWFVVPFTVALAGDSLGLESRPPLDMAYYQELKEDAVTRKKQKGLGLTDLQGVLPVVKIAGPRLPPPLSDTLELCRARPAVPRLEFWMSLIRANRVRALYISLLGMKLHILHNSCDLRTKFWVRVVCRWHHVRY